MKFDIEITCDNDKWYEILPDVEEVITHSCINAVKASSIDSLTDLIEVSVLLSGDSFIKQLNSQFREKNRPTNVLSFPGQEYKAGEYGATPYVMLGDIALALETIQKEAEEETKSFHDHLCHLVIHGTLHLLGYDHEKKKDAELMEGLEVKILKDMGISDPYV